MTDPVEMAMDGAQARRRVYAHVSDAVCAALRGVFALEDPPAKDAEWGDTASFLLLEIGTAYDAVTFRLAQRARDAGMPVVGMTKGPQEQVYVVELYASCLSLLLIGNRSLLQRCISEAVLPTNALLLVPGIVDTDQYHPLASRLDYGCVWHWTPRPPQNERLYIAWQESVQAALAGAFGMEAYKTLERPDAPQEARPGLCVLYPQRETGALDARMLQLAATGQNVVLGAPCDEERLYFRHLFPSARKQRGIIALVDTLRTEVDYAARLRVCALRIVMEQFSARSVARRIGRALGIGGEPPRGAVVVAPCATQAQLQRARAQYEAQSYVDRRLVIVSAMAVDLQPGESIVAPAAFDALSLGEIVWPGEAVALFDPDCSYGPAYLQDLADALDYARVPMVMKAAGFVTGSEGTVRTQADSYQYAELFCSKRGLWLVAPGEERTGADLLSGSLSGEAAIIDPFQWIDGVPDAGDLQADFCMGQENADHFSTVETMQQQARRDAYARQDAAGTLRLDVEMFAHEDAVTVHEDTLQATLFQMQTLELSPVGYDPQADRYASAKRGQDLSAGLQVQPDRTYRLSADLSGNDTVDVTLIVVVYGAQGRILEGKITSMGYDNTHIRVPKEGRYIVPFLRLKGIGEARIRSIRLEPVEPMEVDLYRLCDTMVRGRMVVRCAYPGKKHDLLIPKGSGLSKLSVAPAKSSFPELVAGGTYSICCEGYAQSPEICIPMLLVYDRKKQLDQVRVPVGGRTVFTLPPDASRVVPVLRMSGQGSVILKRLYITPVDGKGAQGGYLVVTNYYPSIHSLYANMYVHVRVQAYRRAGLDVRVFVVKRQAYGRLNAYAFEGVDVRVGNLRELSEAIDAERPQKALIHFLTPQIRQGLDEAAYKPQLMVWSHGADIHPAYYRLFNMANYREASAYYLASSVQVKAIERTLADASVRWIPVSKAYQADFQAIYDIENADRFTSIPNSIDTQRYAYTPKDAAQRFRIVTVKSFNTPVYAGEMVAEAIEALSVRPIFEKLTFTIYGRGDLFFETLGGVMRFANVHVYEDFLTQEELAGLYTENGVMLMPTRYDTHGVSRDEAMSCGVVPVTTEIAAVPEFVDAQCGILTPPNDAQALADAIQRLAEDAELFLRMSQNAARRVRTQNGFKQTLQREIELIQTASSAPKEGLRG